MSARIPIRAQLTIILVVLVVTLATTLSYISFRAVRRSLEDGVILSLETAAESGAHAADTLLAHKYERLANATMAVELACGISEEMNVSCAKDLLLPFLRTEHLRSLRLNYGSRGVLDLGTAPLSRPPGTPMALQQDDNGRLVIAMAYRDPDYNLALQADYAPTVLGENALSMAARPVLIANLGGAVRNILSGGVDASDPAAVARCGLGMPGWSLESRQKEAPTYRVYRQVQKLGVCAVTQEPQSTVLLPLARVHGKLVKATLGFMAACIALAYLMGYFLSHPLQVMRRRVRQLRRGDYDSPVPIVGTGEIRDFSETFAAMAESLRASRQALMESERRLMLAHKAASLWLWKYDMAAKSIIWEAPDHAGQPTRTLSLRAMLRLIDERDRRAAIEAIRASQTTGTLELECRLHRAQQEEARWFAIWGQSVTDATGGPRVFTGVGLDATARKSAERLVQEREKLVATTELAASLAHEVNNPLSSVINALQLTVSCGTYTPEVKRYLEIAQQESERLARISRDTLALYRQPAEIQAVNMRCLLQDVVADCRPQAQRKQQKLEVKLGWLGSVRGFGEELRPALVNLLQHAVEQAPDGGTIILRAHRAHSFGQVFSERGVRIFVASESEALRPDETPSNGAGTGLWLARSVVWKHGGSMRTRSGGVGRKGVFCAVFLPLRGSEMPQAS